MNSLNVCLLLIWAAEPGADLAPPLYQMSPRLAASIRGQSPTPSIPYTPMIPAMPGALPAPGTPVMQGIPVVPGSPTVPATPGGTTGPILSAPLPAPGNAYGAYQPSPAGAYDPFQPNVVPGPMIGGPEPAWLGPQPWQAPLSAAPLSAGPMMFGGYGSQPYRLGWLPRLDVGYIPQEDIKGAASNVEMFELDTELRFNSPMNNGWVLSTAGQFNYRAWNFGGLAGGLLGRANLYRWGFDIQMTTPEVEGWSIQFDFNPSIDTDTEHRLTSDSYNFDSYVAARYRVDPALMFVLGVQYWDRVDDIVLPIGGVVFNPNDLWEFRLLFPNTRITRYLGYFWQGQQWLYMGLDYHVEAYQIDVPGVSPRNRLQYEDWRLSVGLRSNHGSFDKYFEAAWLFKRNFEFEQALGKFNVDDGFLIRGGIRF